MDVGHSVGYLIYPVGNLLLSDRNQRMELIGLVEYLLLYSIKDRRVTKKNLTTNGFNSGLLVTSSLLSCSVGAAKGNPFLEHDGFV